MPALFIVPMTVTSPSLIGSEVTMPSIGAVTVVLDRESRLAARSAMVEFIRDSVAARVASAVSRLDFAFCRSASARMLPLCCWLARSKSNFACAAVALAASRSWRMAARLASRPCGLRGELRAVDLQQELALLDLVPLLDGQVDDLAHDQGGHVDLALGLDLAVGRDLGDEVELLDLGGRDARDVLILAPDGRGQGADDDDRQPGPENDFGLLGHALNPPVALFQGIYFYGVAPGKFNSPEAIEKTGAFR